MPRLSLRLPESLHRQLTLQARREGVSLNQYLVFLLSRYSTPAYSIAATAESAEEQQAGFERLRTELGSATDKELQAVLDERERVPPEPGWTPELRERFEQRLATARKATTSS